MSLAVTVALRASALHGQGIFALAPVEKGATIADERALWAVELRAALLGSGSARRMVARALEGAATEDDGEMVRFVNRLLALQGGEGMVVDEEGLQAEYRVVSERLKEVLILNGVAERGKGPREWVAVFEEAARFNHSCAPNAVRTVGRLEDGEYWCQVVATKDIAAGEEILVNYVDPLDTTAARQEALSFRWSFTCTCRLCARPENDRKTSDERRKKIKDSVDFIDRVAERRKAPRSANWTQEELKNYHQGLDTVALGPAGWQTVERLVALEKIDDYVIYQCMDQASHAASRLSKLRLETTLVDRMLRAARDFKVLGSEERSELVRRREGLKIEAMMYVAMARGSMERRHGEQMESSFKG